MYNNIIIYKYSNIALDTCNSKYTGSFTIRFLSKEFRYSFLPPCLVFAIFLSSQLLRTCVRSFVGTFPRLSVPPLYIPLEPNEAACTKSRTTLPVPTRTTYMGQRSRRINRCSLEIEGSWRVFFATRRGPSKTLERLEGESNAGWRWPKSP